MAVEQIAQIGKALGDVNRLRALMLLADGELCLCHLIDVLGLAPSTVSQHMSVLHAAGLVARRKEGKWHYYRLAGKDAPEPVRRALRWVQEGLGVDPAVERDRAARCCTVAKDADELCACYRTSC